MTEIILTVDYLTVKNWWFRHENRSIDSMRRVTGHNIMTPDTKELTYIFEETRSSKKHLISPPPLTVTKSPTHLILTSKLICLIPTDLRKRVENRDLHFHDIYTESTISKESR